MKKIILQTLAVLAIIIIVSSCQYKFIVEPVPDPPAPGDTVSFSLQVEPIFSDRNCVSCHQAGQTQPNLTTGNAYNSITSMGLTDTADPEASIIYTKPLPTGNHYIKYTNSNAATVLLWIQEGAKNN